MQSIIHAKCSSYPVPLSAGRVFWPFVSAKSGGLGDHEIVEVGVLCRGFIRPEQEQRAAFLGAVRTMRLAGPDVK